MALKVAASQGRKVAVCDIPAAFLQSLLPSVQPPNVPSFRRILSLNINKDENILKYLKEIHPELEQHYQNDELYMLVKK